jgi:hypothetical protein
MSRRLLSLSLALFASLVLAACGQEAQDEGGFQTENAQVAETEGIYLDLDGLKYQVQVSRQLNPFIVSDRAYFIGVEEDELVLEDDEVWFGVFIRAENVIDEPVRTSDDFAIRDTQENIYRPLFIGPENVFAYRPDIVQGGELQPDTDSAAGERSPNGALLLFKLPRFSLDNRPLELIVVGNEGERAIVDLDV